MRDVKKRQFAVFLAAVLCIAAFSSCTKKTTEVAFPIYTLTRAELIEKYAPSVKQAYDYNHSSFVERYLSDKYADFEPYGFSVSDLGGFSSDLVYENASVFCSDYEIHFQTKAAVSLPFCTHEELKTDGLLAYDVPLQVISISSHSELFLSAVLEENPVQNFQDLYTLMKEDKRFTRLPLVETAISSNVQEVNSKKFAQHFTPGETVHNAYMLNEDTVLFFTYLTKPTNTITENLYLFHLPNEKLIYKEQIPESYNAQRLEDGKLYLAKQGDHVALQEVRVYDKNGFVSQTTEPYAANGHAVKSYLSDGTCILEEKRSLYLLDEKAGTKKLLIQGNNTDDIDVERAYFYGEIDKNRFLYSIGGWEWTVETGIYDLSTHNKMPFTKTEETFYPISIFGTTIYFAPSYYDNADVANHVMKLDADTMEFTTLFNFSDKISRTTPTISPNGEKIAFLLKKNDEGHVDRSVDVEIYSLKDFSLLQKESITTQTSVPQGLAYTSEQQLAVLSVGLASHDYAFFLIDLKLNK